MLLHFYTAFKNIADLEKGERALFWNKAESVPTDIYVSLDTEEYQIEKIIHTVFSVQKKITSSFSEVEITDSESIQVEAWKENSREWKELAEVYEKALEEIAVQRYSAPDYTIEDIEYMINIAMKVLEVKK